MTIMDMLQVRCDFRGNAPRKMPEAVSQSLPEELLDFFRQTDGGRGWLSNADRREHPDLFLYRWKRLDVQKRKFLEQVQEAYECWVLLAGRSLNREEKERLALLGESLTVLGECGDPEAPDFLCLREGTYFLAEYRSLEDLLRESPGKPALEETSYTVFLDRVLRALELSRLEWLEMEQEEQTEDDFCGASGKKEYTCWNC